MNGNGSLFIAAGVRQMDAHHGVTGVTAGIADLAIVGVAIVVVVVSLYLCGKYLLRPGEGEDSHIKRRILDDGTDLDRR
ncbi:MAG TPA: hypothetical protein VLD40_00835 [Dissulfurispiraceae bacterium]|nr:hypothetical protein [Dissulfurispiraceae bacterium]